MSATPSLFADAASARAALALIDVEGLLRRVLTDALCEADGTYWANRAEALEACRPQPGDFTGRATPAELAALDRRCAASALACRRHARLLRDRETSTARDNWAELVDEEIRHG